MKNFSIAGTFSAAVVLMTALVALETQEFSYPPTVSMLEVRERVDQAPISHPRLLASREELLSLRAAVDEDPLRSALKEAIIEQAEMIWNLPPVERKLRGRRLLAQSRVCLKRVVGLSMAFFLSGDPEHVRRCERELLAAARFEDWNPSHFLDVAEMTLALAIGYDWLYNELSETVRREIRQAIIEKGVSLPFDTEHNRWVQARNNWGQVCHGGLTAGALAVLEHEPELAARTIHSALQNVTHSMQAYAPRGSYPEGPAYWAYGTSYNVLLIEVLESVLGTDFGLSRAPGFRETGQYLSLVTGPSGQFFNYSDGAARRGPEAVLFWFADRYGRPEWLLGEPGRLRTWIDRLDAERAASAAGRMLPLALLWMDREPDIQTIRTPLHWQSRGETPIAVHRSSWTDPDAIYIGLKGGSPSGNHGQMDIGSFVLDAGGVRWASDLGAEGYHGIESRGMDLWNRAQDSDRWTIFRQGNQGHNTLVIDQQPQRVSGRAMMIRFSEDSAFPHSVVDMSSVYTGQAESVLRGVALIDSQEVLIQDQLSGLRPGSRVRWGMITPGSPQVLEGSRVELRQEDSTLTLEILSPQAAAWRIIDIASPRNEWDSPNPGFRMLAFESIAPESGRLRLAVLAKPGASIRKRDFRLQPLEEWSKGPHQ